MKVTVMKKSSLAKNTLPPAKGFVIVKPSLKYNHRVSQPSPPITTPEPAEPETPASDLDRLTYLRDIAKYNKVKGWNFYKTAEGLENKLNTLGISF